jgi:hypothetical protein
MDINQAVDKIIKQVQASGIGTRFSYEEINDWLQIKSGEDLMWGYDKLSEQLTRDHAIDLELEKDSLKVISQPGPFQGIAGKKDPEI